MRIKFLLLLVFLGFIFFLNVALADETGWYNMQNGISGVVSGGDDSNDDSGTGSGGGGGGGSNYCTAIVYGDWGACSGNVKIRTFSSKSPDGCVLSVAQQLSLMSSCSSSTDNGSNNANNQTNNTGSQTSNPAASESNTDLINKINKEAADIFHTDLGTASSSSSNPDNTPNNGTGGGSATPEIAKIINPILKGIKDLSPENKGAITEFVAQGTPSTNFLGSGERAGVVNSYKKAYKKVPTNEQEWQDLMKISLGRWPSERNAEAEKQAQKSFKRVYLRLADLTNNKDENALMVVTYGLRPLNRNLDSETTAIKTFKFIYGRSPSSAADWDLVRTIAYSGAKR